MSSEHNLPIRSPVYYFAYGSNLSVGRIQARIPEATPVEAARLEGWRLTYDKAGLDGSAKANVVRAEGNAVWGAVYQMPQAGIGVLDGYETGYRRETISLVGSSGTCLEAEVYIAPPGTAPEGVLPFSWYANHIVQGAVERALPAPYVDWLRSVETSEDADRARDALERSRSPQGCPSA